MLEREALLLSKIEQWENVAVNVGVDEGSRWIFVFAG